MSYTNYAVELVICQMLGKPRFATMIRWTNDGAIVSNMDCASAKLLESLGVNDPDLEFYLQEFEKSFFENGDADLADFLPSTDHSQYHQIGVELIRSHMELTWQQNSKPLADYQERFPQILQESRYIEPVAFEEYRLRTQAGETVLRSEYEEHFGIKTNHWPELTDSTTSNSKPETAQLSTVEELEQSTESLRNELSARLGTDKSLVNLTTVESRLHRRLRFISLDIYAFTCLSGVVGVFESNAKSRPVSWQLNLGRAQCGELGSLHLDQYLSLDSPVDILAPTKGHGSCPVWIDFVRAVRRAVFRPVHRS